MSNTIANRIAAAAERISSLLGPHMMRYIAHFNKRVTNPIQRLWASRLHHMAVIEHRGRSTGKDYRTPVMAFVVGGEFVVFLNYRTESDWVRNVQAASSASRVSPIRRPRLILRPRTRLNPSLLNTVPTKCPFAAV
jgi:hypothetical protein